MEGWLRNSVVTSNSSNHSFSIVTRPGMLRQDRALGPARSEFCKPSCLGELWCSGWDCCNDGTDKPVGPQKKRLKLDKGRGRSVLQSSVSVRAV